MNYEDIVKNLPAGSVVRENENYVLCRCPFCGSETFTVDKKRNCFSCWSINCCKGGNPEEFLMKYKGMSGSEIFHKKSLRSCGSDLYKVNRAAMNIFHKELMKKDNPGYKYLSEKRGLSDITLKRFSLGWCSKNNDLYDRLLKSGFTEEDLNKSGIFSVNDRGERYYKFSDRVIFPILDLEGKVSGFGGRITVKKENSRTPKYLNSSASEVYDKSEILYGMNYAAKSKSPFIIICEGYMDVIAMHQAGFTNAVASLGTAFTGQHALLLKRYTDQVILTYDSDGAGVKAALRAIPILKDAGLSVKVLNMKPYKDPDEFMKNLGAGAFRERIAQAKNSFGDEIDLLKSGYDMDDPEQKTRFYQETARKLLEFSEPLERDNYIQAISREHFIPYEDLKRLVGQLGSRMDLRPAARPFSEKAEAKRPKREKEDGIRQSERLLLTWLIENPALFDKIEGIISPGDFTEDLYRQAAEKVFAGHAAGNLNPAAILNHFINDEDAYREVAALFHAELKESLNNEEQKKAFSETVRKIKKNSLDIASRNARDIGELQRIIKEQAKIRVDVVIIRPKDINLMIFQKVIDPVQFIRA